MNIDVFSSECSSGSESGWTLYLEQSMINPPYPSHIHTIGIGNQLTDAKGVFAHQAEEEEEEEEEEEDLSMVSDASSGPPHFHDNEYCGNNDDKARCFYQAPVDAAFPKNNSISRRQRSKEHQGGRAQEQQHNSFLDDTASSPIYNLSNNNVPLTSNQDSITNISDFSQGYSTNHFERSSAYPDHYNFFQSTQSQNQPQQNHWFEETRVGMR